MPYFLMCLIPCERSLILAAKRGAPKPSDEPADADDYPPPLFEVASKGESSSSKILSHNVMLYTSSASTRGELLTLEDIGVRFSFFYTPRLIFLHEKELRNYYTWGFDQKGCCFTAEELNAQDLLDGGGVVEGLCVRHVGVIDGFDVGYGLFTDRDIEKGIVIGEYVGVVTSLGGTSSPYCFSYPSGDGGHSVDSLEYGNLMRFMNHSDDPNCEYHTVFHEAILHLVAVAKCDISAGNQLFFNYGASYWHSRGWTPARIKERGEGQPAFNS